MNDSFLPTEYTEQRIDRRTHILAMLLFIVVMAAVFTAFLWKRNEWKQVELVRQDVETRYQAAGEKVNHLMELKEAQQATVRRAELAAALVEKVPRSILLAELINNMPPGLGLHELTLDSTRLIAPKETASATGRKPRSDTRTAKANEPPEPPRYHTRLALTGFAPTDVHVSEFLSALNDHPLLVDVNLVSSQETVSEDRTVREFKLTASLQPMADVRSLGGNHVGLIGFQVGDGDLP
ncbi:MAG: PilN domain-containing protein [Phycisphaerales bacterium]|nr:PilN domain-containing protein [Phycisphaerales bacterium]